MRCVSVMMMMNEDDGDAHCGAPEISWFSLALFLIDMENEERTSCDHYFHSPGALETSTLYLTLKGDRMIEASL